MAYGIIKVDTVTFTSDGVDKSVTLSGLVQNPTFSGNVTVTGTLSGVTVTGTTANFVSGVFSSQISGTTVTGTTASFTSGVFTNISGGTHTITSGVFAAGSAASPSISFTSDPNTGIYSPGADQVAISTNGTGRLFVDASGNIGVSQLSPGTKLHVAGGNISILQSGGGAYISSRRCLGTVDSPTVINAADVELGGTFYSGWDGSSYSLGAQVVVGSTAAFSVGSTPAYYAIKTTPSGSASPLERLRITSAGNVGIGTSTPGTVGGGATLNIDAAGGARVVLNSASRRFYITGASGSDDIRIGRRISTDTLDSDIVTITGGGNVGIGTTSPTHSLDVNSAIRLRGAGASTEEGDLHLYYVSDTNRATLTSSTNGAIVFENGIGTVSERARIDSSGRLLVGTSSARTNFNNSTVSAALQVEGTGGDASSASLVRNSNDANPSAIRLAKSRGTSNGSNTVVASGDVLGSIQFQGADGTEFVQAAIINAEVDGTPGANDMPGRLVFSTTADGASSPTERMRIASNGVININATGNPWQATGNDPKVQIEAGRVSAANYQSSTFTANRTGSNGSVFDFYREAVFVGSISVTASATAYNTSSDYRLKENVTPVTDGITRLQQLKPSRFNFIADPDKTVDGFLAHEVQAIVPEAITGEKDAVDDEGNPQYQGIDQSKLVPLLTAALQEAVAKIESLEARLTAAGI